MSLPFIGFVALSFLNLATADAASEPAPPLEDSAYSVERQEMRAQLSPRRYTTLSAELGAKISRITVKDGERFRAGERLVELDCVLQAAQLDRARAQLAAADNVYAGNQRLADLNSIGQVELRSSEAEVRKARADVSYIETTLQKCEVLAPFSGRVAEQKAREQQFVQPGQALLEILDDTELELEFILPSRWLTWLKVGHSLRVFMDDTSREYPAHIVRMGAKADPVSQTIKVTAVIDGRHPELIAGMSGKVIIDEPVRRRSNTR